MHNPETLGLVLLIFANGAFGALVASIRSDVVTRRQRRADAECLAQLRAINRHLYGVLLEREAELRHIKQTVGDRTVVNVDPMHEDPGAKRFRESRRREQQRSQGGTP